MHLHASDAVWEFNSHELGFSPPNKKDFDNYGFGFLRRNDAGSPKVTP